MSYTIGLISLGCAKNRVNSEQMLFLLKEAGFYIQAEVNGADAVIVNTCGFIESAKTEAIETILELGRLKEEGRIRWIIVAGCLPERYKNEILPELPEIDAVVGVGGFEHIVKAVRAVTGEDKGKPAFFGDIHTAVSETNRILTTSPSWAYLKIAEGCDNRCAYCVIPDIRGRFRSRPMENILKEAETLADRGVKELILVAQDTTAYGFDLYEKYALPELLDALCNIKGLRWIRLHYLYPNKIDDKLVDTVARNEKVVKYLDIPIQHISDNILEKMRRRGSGSEIRAVFRRIREKIPGVVLRTSVIAGLPGEGEKEFDELCAFLREAEIERAGVFTYSPEEGTDAALFDRPDTETAERRARILTDISQRIYEDFDERRIGKIETVLIEGKDGAGFYGRSFAESPEIDGYITIEAEDLVIGEFYDVKITAAGLGVRYLVTSGLPRRCAPRNDGVG